MLTLKDNNPFETFVGAGKALDYLDIPHLAYRIDVEEDHLQAFLNVESRSTGYDRSGRPVILTEPHVFYRNLKGAERDEAVRLGLAYKRWGEKPYPKTSDARYAWLKKAMDVNQTAALMACSWGSTQVLGENATMVGYPTVQDMVQAFMNDEEEHVEAMVKFILATGIADDLKAERWNVVARIYNGPGYKKNKYHVKMANEFAKLRGVTDKNFAPARPQNVELIVPDKDMMKSIQTRLGELGYTEVGWADGHWGTKTRSGVVAFRIDKGLPIYDGIDKDFMVALMGSGPREIGEDRRTTTVADLRDAGSRQVQANDSTGMGGGAVGIGGAVGVTGVTLKQIEDQSESVSRIFDTVTPYMDMIVPILPWAALGVGAFVWWNSRKGNQARLEDHQTGKTSFAGPISMVRR